MNEYQCKECGFKSDAKYWNDTLRGQIMSSSDEYMPIEDAPEGIIWKCPGCMGDVEVEEVK